MPFSSKSCIKQVLFQRPVALFMGPKGISARPWSRSSRWFSQSVFTVNKVQLESGRGKEIKHALSTMKISASIENTTATNFTVIWGHLVRFPWHYLLDLNVRAVEICSIMSNAVPPEINNEWTFHLNSPHLQQLTNTGNSFSYLVMRHIVFNKILNSLFFQWKNGSRMWVLHCDGVFPRSSHT